MYSRRRFLIGLFLFTPLLFSQMGLLNSIHNNILNKRSGKFMKQGWLLQVGDI